ncbi:MAG: UDP-glucuronate 4-epimerase [Lentisphaeria bacterium]|jgi:UDP-glucuronate 4-epimerase
MALFTFAKGVIEGTPIGVYNHGEMFRDFTYIGDIVEGLIRISDKIPSTNVNWSGDAPYPSSSFAPHCVYNIGNNKPVKLTDFIEAIETCTGKPAIKNMCPFNPVTLPLPSPTRVHWRVKLVFSLIRQSLKGLANL